MTAKDMFINLGYTLEREDDDYVIYTKDVGHGVIKEISFSDQLESFCVTYENNPGIDTPSIGVELLSAINKQVEELGWGK